MEFIIVGVLATYVITMYVLDSVTRDRKDKLEKEEDKI